MTEFEKEIDRDISGRSITFSVHKSFRGFGSTTPYKGIRIINFGWLRIDIRDHIENQDRRVENLTGHDPESMHYYYRFKEGNDG